MVLVAVVAPIALCFSQVIGAHSVEVNSRRAAASANRLIRLESGFEAQELKSDEAVVEDVRSEISMEAVVDRTIRTLHNNKGAALLATQGPAKLQPSVDPFNASVSAMKKLSNDGSIDCSANYGEQMLKNLMLERSVHHVCSGHSSTITCHEREPFDIPRYMCELKNVMISAQGTSVSGCEKQGDFEDFTKKQGITENNIFGSYTKFGGLNLVKGKLDCASNSSSRAIVQVPANTENFYEWYGDWVTLWETLAAMKWNPKDAELYLVGNLSGHGQKYARPFDEAWSRAFKAGSIHVGTYDKLFGEGICFSQIVTAPQGALSTMTFRGGRGGVVGCPAPTMMASALFLQALFPAPPAPPASGKTLTLMLRKGSRAFESDDDAISAVKSVLPKDWSLRLYRAENVTTLAEQLAVAATSQVLVGVHGAGMMHVLFLPPKARVVEIFCEDRPRGNRHFQNLESMAEPSAHPHLFSYYFDASYARCRIDKQAVANAIKAFDSPAPEK